MPAIPLEPHQAPKVEAYKYFSDRLTGKLKYNNKVINVVFTLGKDKPTYPRVYIDFYRRKVTDRLRYIGDEVKVKNLKTGNIEMVTIGEPFEGFWKICIEDPSRDVVYNIDQQIRVIMGRTGCVREPFYIEHSRHDRIDYEGDNTLVKKDSDSLLFVNHIGYRLYMRLSGGYPVASYEPRPPVETIILELTPDGTQGEEVTIDGDSNT